MKKLMFLFIISTFFILASCAGGSSSEEKTNQMVCTNTVKGCLPDHSCCIIKDASKSSKVIMSEETTESDSINEEKVIKVVNSEKE